MTSQLSHSGQLLIAFVSVALAASCGTPGGSTPRTQPVQPVWDQRPCTETAAANWSNYWPELRYDSNIDRQCPYQVLTSGSPIPFFMQFDVSWVPNPVQWIGSGFSIKNNQNTIIASGQWWWFVSIDTYGNLRSRIESSFPGGTGSSPVLDSAYFTVWGGSGPGYPWVRVALPGNVAGTAPLIAGGSYVVSGYPQVWSADVSGEPVAYRHRWFVNGQLASTDRYLTATLTPGSHTIKLESRLSDESVLNQTLDVTAVDCGGPDMC